MLSLREGDNTVRITLQGNQICTFTAKRLEDLGLGNGSGKWRLMVTATNPVMLLSLIQTKTGHLINLSYTPAGIRVIARLVEASFTYEEDDGIPFGIHFDATASKRNITDYAWDFGEDSEWVPDTPGTGPTPLFVYDLTWFFAGTRGDHVGYEGRYPATTTYPVTLTGTDRYGAEATHTKRITVTAGPKILPWLEGDVVLEVVVRRRALRGRGVLCRALGTARLVIVAARRRLIGPGRPARPPATVATAAVAAPIEHLHFTRDHLGGVALLAVLPLPGARLQAPFDIYLGALAQVLVADLRQAGEADHAVPIGAVAPLVGGAILPAVAGGDAEVGDRTLILGVADLGVAPQIADQNNFVDAASHGCSHTDCYLNVPV